MSESESRRIKYFQGEREIYIPTSERNLKCSVIKRVNEGKVWETRISKRIFNDTKPNTMAIDIGANIGVHTISMIDAVGKNGFVIAFEPQICIRECLRKTLYCYDGNYIISGDLVSDKNNKETFYSDGTGRSRIPIEGDRYSKNWEKSIKNTTTLDSYLTWNHPPISLIKIDVEGHEFQVLKGSQETIDKYKPIIYIEVWSKKGDYEKLVKWCADNNYKIEKISPNDYKLASKE